MSGREQVTGDPVAVLARWIAEAGAAGAALPNAMTLATTDGSGAPHARTVLVTAVTDAGLRLHSSDPTTKTRDVAANPRAAGVFWWADLRRQVTVHGRAEELDAAVSRAAFPGRPIALRRLAWAYDTLLPDLTAPDLAVDPEAVQRAFIAAGDPTAVPPSWTTLALVPERLDFWQAGTDEVPATRTRFTRVDGGWRRATVLP